MTGRTAPANRTGLTRFRQVLMAALITLPGLAITGLAACGDPGTGGSGLPNSSASPTDPIGAAAALAYQVVGTVESLDAHVATISAQVYADTQLDIVLPDGRSGTFANLLPGQRVGLNPLANTSPARWSLRILGP